MGSQKSSGENGKQDTHYLGKLQINATQPCLADPEKLRFISLVDKPIAQLFPYVNAVIKGALYNANGHNITLKKGERIISLHPSKIAGAKVFDIKDAEETLEWVVEILNDCYRRQGEIVPDYEMRARLGVLDVYKLLPANNCKSCGLATCLAFSASLCKGEKILSDCTEVWKQKYGEKRGILVSLLADAGYDAKLRT